MGTRRAAGATPPHRALEAKTAQTLELQTPWKAQIPPDPGLQKRKKPSLRPKRLRWSEGSRGRRGRERSKATRKAFRARKCRRWSRKGGQHKQRQRGDDPEPPRPERP